MKKTLILACLLLGIINFTFAQDAPTKNKAFANFFFKGSAGYLTPLSNTSPSVLKSNDYTYAYSFGFMIGGFAKNKFSWGIECGGFQSKLINNDKTLGLDDNYILNGGLYKFVFQYNFNKYFNIYYNIGGGSIECQRPWFVIPANLATNGKKIEEYPTKIINGCFVTGIGININPLKWLSLNANIDYIGTTFKFENVVHSEDKYVTNVYNPNLKLRAYILTVGLVLRTPY